MDASIILAACAVLFRLLSWCADGTLCMNGNLSATLIRVALKFMAGRSFSAHAERCRVMPKRLLRNDVPRRFPNLGAAYSEVSVLVRERYTLGTKRVRLGCA
jgi:hypothetical protein